MATRIVEYPVKDGSTATLLVEVDTDHEEKTGYGPVARDDGAVVKATRTLDDALIQVMPGIDTLIGHLQDLARKPDEFGLEFGVKLSLEAGALIAKTAIEGNIKVSLKWSAKQPAPQI